MTKRTGAAATAQVDPEQLGEEIARLEAEQAELEGPEREWSFDELVARSAEFEAKERRRALLPRIIQAAKVRRLELEQRRHEEQAASLQGEVESTYAAFQEREAKLRRAKEERDAAHGQWTLAMSAMHSAQDRAKRTGRELRALRGEGTR